MTTQQTAVGWMTVVLLPHIEMGSKTIDLLHVVVVKKVVTRNTG